MIQVGKSKIRVTILNYLYHNNIGHRNALVQEKRNRIQHLQKEMNKNIPDYQKKLHTQELKDLQLESTKFVGEIPVQIEILKPSVFYGGGSILENVKDFFENMRKKFFISNWNFNTGYVINIKYY